MPNRRAFITSAATVAAAAALARQAASQNAPNPAVLDALGDTVLPESLGVARRRKIVRQFEAWLAAYTPVTEEMHGYGDAEITYTPPDPAPGWWAQLGALDLLAKRRHRTAFGGLPLATRRAIVESELSRIRNAALPGNPLVAQHVAIALLAFWAASTEATDIAYGVKIGKSQCRVLGETVRKPLPLAPTE